MKSPTTLAAEAVRDSKSRLYKIILADMHKAGERGRTCDESEVQLRMLHQTCSARYCELRQAGFIEQTGKRRRTRYGCTADVYKVAK